MLYFQLQMFCLPVNCKLCIKRAIEVEFISRALQGIAMVKIGFGVLHTSAMVNGFGIVYVLVLCVSVCSRYIGGTL